MDMLMNCQQMIIKQGLFRKHTEQFLIHNIGHLDQPLKGITKHYLELLWNSESPTWTKASAQPKPLYAKDPRTKHRYSKQVKKELLHQKFPHNLFHLESQMDNLPSSKQMDSYNRTHVISIQ
jgi:hypothetical protein